jgi:DNA-binding NarL/FixJ family response regulator
MKTSIAIVEDNPELLRHFSETIQSDERLSLVGTASSGAEALALINRSRADVYLVDLGLPDMNGTQVIRHALKTYADCEVMVITVFGDEVHVVASVEAGATGYILKDSSPSEIVDSVHALRAGGSPVSPAIARKILKMFSVDKGTLSEPKPPLSEPSLPVLKTALTDRETETLRLLAKGLSFAEIGDSLSISDHTVARHVKHIYRKLAVHSRGEAVYEASKMGLINL